MLAEIRVVISNKADALGLKRAQAAGIPTEIVSAQPQESREDYDQRLVHVLNAYQPKLIVLAGFMRILTSLFIDQFPHRVINIHPSLLPNHRGLNTHERVLAAKDAQHGTTIHLVTVALDDGPILAQAKCYVSSDDTAASLKEKIQRLEHQLYPKVIQLIASGRLLLEEKAILLDKKPIEQPIEL